MAPRPTSGQRSMVVLLICTLLSFTTSIGPIHDFHVSRCEIVYRTDNKSLEITMHVFADDVEIALRKLAGSDDALHLSTEIETDTAEKLLQAYMAQHLAVTIGSKPLELTYLGKEPGAENAAMWVYVEGVNCPKPIDVTIRYDLLCEIFKDQKNITSFQIDNKEKQMYLLDRSTPEVSFSTR